jgi:hypothetical protein
VAFETGPTTSYALFSCQDRGNLFLPPGVPVYKGQIIGIHQRPGDLTLNACKRKAATNVRSNKEATGSCLTPINLCGVLERIILSFVWDSLYTDNSCFCVTQLSANLFSCLVNSLMDVSKRSSSSAVESHRDLLSRNSIGFRSTPIQSPVKPNAKVQACAAGPSYCRSCSCCVVLCCVVLCLF